MLIGNPNAAALRITETPPIACQHFDAGSLAALRKLYLILSIIMLLMFLPPARAQAVANIAYTGSSYGYACILDSKGPVVCLAEIQNFTIAFGNYTLTAYDYSPSYVFNHWITQGNLTVADIQGNNTLLTVNGGGNLAAVFLPASQNGTARVTFSGVRGYVCFLDYSNDSGPVCLTDGQNVTMPTGEYIAEAAPYNESDSFVKWSTQGLVSVQNQTAYITNVTVGGNGILALAYSETLPSPEIPLGAVPMMLAFSAILTLPLRRKGRLLRVP